MKANKIRLALIGSDTLLGREIKDVLESSDAPASIESYAANAEANFGEEDGEPIYREAFGPEAASNTDTIITAGSAEGATKALELAKTQKKRLTLVDCTGTLESQPEARIVAPLLDVPTEKSWLTVMAHPAAMAIAMILRRLSKQFAIERAVFEIFEPASERGKLGIGELQKQTTNLLSLRPLEKEVFDMQVSFNMLPAYGEEAKANLGAFEQRIEKDLATLLARGPQTTAIPMPSLRLIQAPVFHGYSISAWVELGSNANAEAVAEALASANIEIRSGDEEVPNNVGVAGQSGLIAGDIRMDRNNPRAVWLWAVADNLRLIADSVTELVKGE